MPHAPYSIGMLGLGAIGSICARHLTKGVDNLAVFDVNAARVAAAVEEGAVAVTSARELGSNCDVVVVSLPNPPAVQSALLGPDGLFAAPRDGLTVVDMSTVDPQTSRDMHLKAKQLGVGYLDAPVSGGQPFSGGVDGAEAGTLTFMVGGEASDIEKASPVLETLGVRVHHLGVAGSGSTVKLISNLMSGIYTLVAAEAFALGAAAGFAPQQLIDVFRDTDAKSYFLTDYLWPRLESSKPRTGFAVDLQLKDHRLAAELAHELAVPMFFNAVAIQTYESMHRHGRGNLDVSAAFGFWADQVRVDLGLEPMTPDVGVNDLRSNTVA